MKIFVSVLVVSAAAALVLNAADKPADKPADDPVAELQGKWVETRNGPEGKTYKIVVVVDGKKDTLSTYEGEKLIHQHTADFEVKRTEQVLIFTYRNRTITVGPGKGTVEKDPVSYLYQIKGDQWFYMFGLLNGDTVPFHGGVYERVKEEPAKLSSDSKQAPAQRS
jgi:hypothetical protein